MGDFSHQHHEAPAHHLMSWIVGTTYGTLIVSMSPFSHLQFDTDSRTVDLTQTLLYDTHPGWSSHCIFWRWFNWHRLTFYHSLSHEYMILKIDRESLQVESDHDHLSTFNTWVHFASSGFQIIFYIHIQQIKAKCTLPLSIFVAIHFRLQCDIIISNQLYHSIEVYPCTSPSSLNPLWYPSPLYIPMSSAFFAGTPKVLVLKITRGPHVRSFCHPLHHSCRWPRSTSPASTRPTSRRQNWRRPKAQKTQPGDGDGDVTEIYCVLARGYD